MTETKESQQDRRILTLAAEIAETRDRNVPILLLRLKDIINSAPVGSKKLAQLKLDIWSYEVLEVLILSLKQDFNHVNGGWGTAASLATLLSHCCVGLDPPGSNEFYQVVLPDAVDKMLMLSRKIQARYAQTLQASEYLKHELFENFSSTLQALIYLFSAQPFLTGIVLRSPWLLQMLITDEPQSAVSVVGLLQSACRANSKVFHSLDEMVRFSLLDELVYKLTVSDNEQIAVASTRTLLTICDFHEESVEVLCNRYKGLRPLLSKWEGRGFGTDLRKLRLLLNAGNAKKAEMEKLYRAASIIQALVKSYLTRKRIRKADATFSRFHQSFRKKRVQQVDKQLEVRQQQELQHRLLVARKAAMRATRQKQLEVLQILPASQVDKYLQEEQNTAATRIQANWRGMRERQKLGERKTFARNVTAALTIQRQVRRWMDKVRATKHETSKWQRPPGLTDERRVEIQKTILERRENYPTAQKSREQLLEQHNYVQGLLRQQVVKSKLTRQNEQHRHALLARLEMDASLLTNAPKLSEVNESDVQQFLSHSIPIATKARQNHNHEIWSRKQPWWKKLGDEYQDRDPSAGQLMF